MNADEGKPGRGPRRPARAGLLAAAITTVALLAAACGGKTSPGAGNGPGGVSVQKIDSFAACMRGHGVPDFYLSPRSAQPNPNSSQVVLSILGHQVTGVDPQTAQFQSAMKSCRHILGLRPPSQAVEHKQFDQALKQAACMRSHGYPDWPDPSMGPNGQGIMVPGPPGNVDPNSPQVQKAAKACGVGLP